VYVSVVVSCERTAIAGGMKRTLSRINRSVSVPAQGVGTEGRSAIWGIPGSDCVGSAAVFTYLTEKHENGTVPQG